MEFEVFVVGRYNQSLQLTFAAAGASSNAAEFNTLGGKMKKVGSSLITGIFDIILLSSCGGGANGSSSNGLKGELLKGQTSTVLRLTNESGSTLNLSPEHWLISEAYLSVGKSKTDSSLIFLPLVGLQSLGQGQQFMCRIPNFSSEMAAFFQIGLNKEESSHLSLPSDNGNFQFEGKQAKWVGDRWVPAEYSGWVGELDLKNPSSDIDDSSVITCETDSSRYTNR